MKTESLPKNWELLEDVDDIIEIAGLRIYRTGLFAKNEDKISIGAASGTSSQRHRAYYELLERIYLQENSDPIKGLDSNYKESLSNGVAIHTSKEAAINSSINELVERDRILRSWFGQSLPKKITNSKFEILELCSLYEIKLYEFSDKLDPRSDIKVTGVFLYPKKTSENLVFGFGASDSIKNALLKSKDELITRLSFLWKEPVESNYKFSPTSAYHQEYYLDPKNTTLINDWLKGENPSKFSKFYDGVLPELKDDIKTNVTEIDHNGVALYLSKAVSKTREKLYFGEKYEIEKSENLVHPIM